MIIQRNFLSAALLFIAVGFAGAQETISKPAGLEVKAVGDHSAHVFEGSDPVQFEIGEKGTGGWTWWVQDWLGAEVAQGHLDAKETRLTVPISDPGYYVLSLQKGGSDAGTVLTVPFARLSALSGKRPDSAFALDTAQSLLLEPDYKRNPFQPDHAAAVVAELAGLSGVGEVRDRVTWSGGSGIYQWGGFEQDVRLMHERGIRTMGLISNCPLELKGRFRSVPEDLAGLYQFARCLAGHFKPFSPDWEFCNEPDLESCQDPAWDYAAAFKAASLGFKAGDYQCRVLPGSISVRPPSRFSLVALNNGLTEYADAVNWHFYSQGGSVTGPAQDNRRLADSFHPGMPLWITEFGSALTDDFGRGNPLVAGSRNREHDPSQEILQAQILVTGLVSAQAAGVGKTFYFVLPPYNEREGWKVWGLLRWDWTVKPAYVALANMVRQLGSFRYLGVIPSDPGVQAHLYENPVDQRQTVVFWSATGGRISVPGTFSRARLVDMMGQESSVSGAVSGSTVLPASPSPQYLTGCQGLLAATPGPTLEGSKPSALAPSPFIMTVVCPPQVEIVNRAAIDFSTPETSLLLRIWNISERDREAVVENRSTDLQIDGCPGRVMVPSFGKKEISLKIRRTPGPAKMVFQATGDSGEAISRLEVPLRPKADDLEHLSARSLPVELPQRWKISSAGKTVLQSEPAEQAIYISTQFPPKMDHWVYPHFNLQFPGESLAKSIGIQFEIRALHSEKSDVRKWKANVVLGTRNAQGKGAWYSVPYQLSEEWKKITVLWEEDAPPGMDPAQIEHLQIGCNPADDECSYWVRHLRVLVAPGEGSP